jgi:hypothetical protein
MSTTARQRPLQGQGSGCELSRTRTISPLIRLRRLGGIKQPARDAPCEAAVIFHHLRAPLTRGAVLIPVDSSVSVILTTPVIGYSRLLIGAEPHEAHRHETNVELLRLPIP